MGHPEDPIRPNNVKVAQSLAIEILEQLDHLEGKLHQRIVSV